MALFSGEVPPDRYLYHYTTAQAALGHILPDRKLRLGLLTRTNDPREYQQWAMSLARVSTQQPSNDEALQIMQETHELIQATTKVACFTCDDPVGMTNLSEIRFARGWAHSRMWHQYAAAHSGVCLIFDRRAIERSMASLESLGTLWHGPVHYENFSAADVDAATLDYEQITQLGLHAVVDAHLSQHYHSLFFLKNRDWAAEWEYRWVFRDGTRTPTFIDISNALAGIVVGHDFPPPYIRLVSIQLGDLGLDDRFIARCQWRNGLPLCLPELHQRAGT